MRRLLVFGAGATLAITQLGAGCVPPDRYGDPDDTDAAHDDAGDAADADKADE